MSNPGLWVGAVEDLHTIQPGAWVSGSIMSLYLLTEWYQFKETSSCYFLDFSQTVGSKNVDPEDISCLRELHLMEGADVELVQKPVVFLVCWSDHYFTVCFNYAENKAWVFGQSLEFDHVVWQSGPRSCDWLQWQGPQYWHKIARLFGWVPSTALPEILSCHFQQVRLFCFSLFQILE
jgi:hypothetical protein